MNPFARVLRIATLAIPFIRELGPYAGALIGVVNGAADELDSPPTVDELAKEEAKRLRELEDAQDKEWFEYSLELAQTPMSDEDRDKLLGDRIRLDLFRASGDVEIPESLVALYKSNIVGAVKIKLAHDGLKRAEDLRKRQSRSW
jgi:hypothetical protein